MSTAASVFQGLREAQQSLLPILYQPGTVEGSYEKAVTEIAQKIMAFCEQDTQAALANILIDHKLNPTLRHAVHTATLCYAYGKQIELMSDEQLSLMCAALTMHVSFAQQQDALWVQDDKLSALQKSSFESHTKLSKKILGEKKVKNSDWINAVMQHHERADGTGFLTMRGDAITKLGGLLGFADRFCMLVMARAMAGEAEPPKFLRYHVRANEEDELLERAAEKLGHYFPGTLVKLKSDEVAVILRQTDDPQHPTVASLGTPGALTLSETVTRETKQDEFAIAEVLDWKASANKFKLCKLWGYDAPVDSEIESNAA